jgi:hypothetical protein
LGKIGEVTTLTKKINFMKVTEANNEVTSREKQLVFNGSGRKLLETSK